MVKKAKKELIKTIFSKERIMTAATDDARELYNSNRFGTLIDNEKVQLSLLETMYLIEKDRIEVFDGRKKKIDSDAFLKKAGRMEKKFWIRYVVFKDLRDRGYIVKTALKFGADFRVYDRGVKPGEDHAKWIIYAVHERDSLTWHGFSAKNRVAHSTKKKLMIGTVDDEGDVTYWEVKWVKP